MPLSSFFRAAAAAASGLGLTALVRAEPDELALGKAEAYPSGTPFTMYEEGRKVGSFSGAARILPSRKVPRGDSMATLTPDAAPPPISYTYKGRSFTLDDYLERQRVTGLLILKGDRILAERYRYGRTERDLFLSFSVAKSVNSLLLGIALERGMIQSLDDLAEKYVPELKGSVYGETSLRNLLHGSSGTVFSERYDGRDDLHRLMQAARGGVPETPLQILASYHDRAFRAGDKFAYTSAESTVLGYVLHRASESTVAELASDWLWKPIGAESDALWSINVDGQEGVEGRFNAALRDYGRLGRLLAGDGQAGGKQVVPRDYLLDATDAGRQPPAFRPGAATPYYGYGMQFWILPLQVRTFACLGIYGQAIYVQPETSIVMVQTAVWREPIDVEAGRERDAFWRGVLRSLGGSLEPMTASKQ